MNIKQEIIKSIRNKEASNYIPMMYRGNLDADAILCEYFNLGRPEEDWKRLLKSLGADIMSNGHTLSRWFTYFPEYKRTSPYHSLFNDPVLYFSWGLDSKVVRTGYGEYINFAVNAPLRDAGIDEIIRYRGPELDDFDFDKFSFDISQREDNFFCTGVLDYIYMLAAYLRGEDRFLIDLAVNKKLAGVLVDKVGEVALAVTAEIYRHHGNKLDMFGIFDDVATQENMIMHPDIWRRLFKKYHKKLIEIVKRYDQIVLMHCCGNPDDIIPDFIEIGIDILDPIQTSARNMSLERLHRLYHKDLVFHGGIDVQRLLPFGTADKIKREVRKVRDIFKDKGFIILGPSHQMPADIPKENIIAIYKDAKD